MLFRAFYALPDTHHRERRPARERAARHGEPGPARGGGALAASGGPVLRPRRGRVPGRALRRLPRGAARGARQAGAAVRRLARLLRGLRLDRGGCTTRSRRTTCSAPTPRLEAEAGGQRARDDRRPRHVPVRHRPGDRALRAHRRPRRRAGGPRRGAQALRRGARAGARLHRAARRPLGRHSRRRGIGEKTAAELLRRHGSLEAALDGRDARDHARACAPRCSTSATSCCASRTSRRCATPV